MAKALLINPSYRDSYGGSKAGIVNPIFPTLSLLTTAAVAEQRGHTVRLLDLSYQSYDHRVVREAIESFRPDVVGITATTPLFNQVRDISLLAKDVSKDIRVVAGGSHVSALPVESLAESLLDLVIVGEGDHTFADVLDGLSPENIPGIHYRKGDGAESTRPRPFVQNLDDLPLPAWHLYDSGNYRYRISRLFARRPPLTSAEFSRGCIYKCDFCASKNTLALGYRKKSPERCAEEARAMKRFGYGEFALADDIFTSDPAWAVAVSEAITRAGVDIAWTCTNGIRVESADDRLFQAMRRAGCYRVSFGFESGNDEVLKKFGKGGRASIEKGREAVRAARDAGIDTLGFFLLGLSPDNEASMEDTIRFARSLPLDMLKFAIAIAFPGTPMFKEYRERGLIRSYDWDDYHVYTERPLFAHPNLSYETVQAAMRRAYREAVLKNPGFIGRRLRRGIRTGEFFWDAWYFLKYLAAPPVNRDAASANYFARDRWPRYDFEHRPITYYPPRAAFSRTPEERLKGITI